MSTNYITFTIASERKRASQSRGNPHTAWESLLDPDVANAPRDDKQGNLNTFADLPIERFAKVQTQPHVLGQARAEGECARLRRSHADTTTEVDPGFRFAALRT